MQVEEQAMSEKRRKVYYFLFAGESFSESVDEYEFHTHKNARCSRKVQRVCETRVSIMH
jgi:hypothetical protein